MFWRNKKMVEVPEKYKEIGMIGYSSKGEYNNEETYVKNDLVSLNGSVWCCLVDDVTGIPPQEGETWSMFARGATGGGSGGGVSQTIDLKISHGRLFVGAGDVEKVRVEHGRLFIKKS